MNNYININIFFKSKYFVLAKSLTNKKFECGTDEAGRGCLAGPVTAAAVILPKKFENKTINDSKIVSESKRIKLREIISDFFL